MKIFTITLYDPEDNVVNVRTFSKKESAMYYAHETVLLSPKKLKDLETTGKTSYEMYNDGQFEMGVFLTETILDSEAT